MTELVSIIMPAYNAGKYIAASIESVQAQRYRHWELIIVDDESKDDTAAIIKAYQAQDERIKYFWQPNGKQGRARNRAIKEASGVYFAFLDADDLWLPDKLAHQLRLLESQDVDLVFGYSYLIQQGVKTTTKIGRGMGKLQGKEAIDFLLYHDAFIMSTVLVKAAAVLKVERFVEDDHIQYCEDWHLWLKLAFENFSFYTDGGVVSYYRISESSACAVENNAPKKLFMALVSLQKRYPAEVGLAAEINRRMKELVYNSPTLDAYLVKTFFALISKKKTSVFVYGLAKLYKINIPVFRKCFLYFYR